MTSFFRYALPALLVIPAILGLRAETGEGAASGPLSSVDRFRDAIEGVVWEAVGTFQVKRVAFSKGRLRALDFSNRTVGVYADTSVMDPGIIKVEYHDGTSGWYAFADDLEVVLPSKVDRWLECKPGGTEAERGREPFWVPQGAFAADAVRLKESTIELSSAGQRQPPIPCHAVTRAVVEFEMGDGTWWAVEARDGATLWLLKVRNSFGGLRWRDGRVTEISSSAPAFLAEREKRLWDFIQQLEKRSQSGEAFSLKSELGRRVTRNFGTNSDESQIVRKLLGLDVKPPAVPTDKEFR